MFVGLAKLNPLEPGCTPLMCARLLWAPFYDHLAIVGPSARAQCTGGATATPSRTMADGLPARHLCTRRDHLQALRMLNNIPLTL